MLEAVKFTSPTQHVHFQNSINPSKLVDVDCSFDKNQDNSWHFTVICTLTVTHGSSQKVYKAEKKFDIKAGQLKTIGCWKSIFERTGITQNMAKNPENDNDDEDGIPLDEMARFGNEPLLEITGYNNTVEFESWYLKVHKDDVEK